MKHLILTLQLLMLVAWAQAQTFKTKTYEKKDSGYVEIVYFPGGKISTIKLTPKHMYSRVEGYAKAYNLQGKEIFNQPVSTLGGHGSITFAYHPNGVIRSVRSTFQPDGGIQHYDATWYYDAEGNFTHEEDNSWDRPTIYRKDPSLQPEPPGQPVVPAPAPVTEPKPEPRPAVLPVAMAYIKAFVENKTEGAIRIRVIPADAKEKPFTLTVKPGERRHVGEYTQAGGFVEPGAFYRVEWPGKAPAKVQWGTWTLYRVADDKAQYVLELLPR